MDPLSSWTFEDLEEEEAWSSVAGMMTCQGLTGLLSIILIKNISLILPSSSFPLRLITNQSLSEMDSDSSRRRKPICHAIGTTRQANRLGSQNLDGGPKVGHMPVCLVLSRELSPVKWPHYIKHGPDSPNQYIGHVGVRRNSERKATHRFQRASYDAKWQRQ